MSKTQRSVKQGTADATPLSQQIAASAFLFCALALVSPAHAAELSAGPSEAATDTSLSPTENAREDWRKLVCSGVTESSSASVMEVASWGRAPSGTILPPSLASNGFVEGWEARMYPAAVSSSSLDEEASAKAAERLEEGRGSLLADGQRLMANSLAFLLPALGMYFYSRRKRKQIASPHVASGTGSGEGASTTAMLAACVAIPALFASPQTSLAGADFADPGDPTISSGNIWEDGETMENWRAHLCNDPEDPLSAAGGGLSGDILTPYVAGPAAALVHDYTPRPNGSGRNNAFYPGLAASGAAGGGSGSGTAGAGSAGGSSAMQAGSDAQTAADQSPGSNSATSETGAPDEPVIATLLPGTVADPTSEGSGLLDPVATPGGSGGTGGPAGSGGGTTGGGNGSAGGGTGSGSGTNGTGSGGNWPDGSSPTAPVPLPPALLLLLSAFGGLLLGKSVARRTA